MHLYRSNNLWIVPWKSSCVSVSMTFVKASFISSIVSGRQPQSLGNKPKVTGSKVWTIGRLRKLSWYPYWSNSLWQGWSYGLVHCPGGNATDPIWRVLASSDGISSWTHLKPQHSNSNPNPNSLANQLWCIDFLTPPKPLIISHRLPAFLMPLKNWCSIHTRCSKSSLKHSILFVAFFPSLKQNFIAYRSSKVFRWHFWNSPAVRIGL